MKPTKEQIRKICINQCLQGQVPLACIEGIINEWEKIREKESCKENIKDIIEEVADYLRDIDLEYFTTDEIATDIVSRVLRL